MCISTKFGGLLDSDKMAKAKILVVEDEAITAMDIQNRLKELDYDVPAIAASGEGAIKSVEEIEPDLVLMDIVLKGDMDGIEAAEQIHDRFDVPVVYLTAYLDEERLEKTKGTAPLGCIIKPCDDKELRPTIEMALQKHKLEKALRNAEQDWRNSFNSLDDVMLIIDRDFNIEKINGIGLKLLGKSKEEVIGEKCYQVISGVDSPGEDCPCMKSLETKKVESLDRYEEIFGKYYSIKTSPIFDENGEIIKFVDLRRDITERKRAEEQIKAALREKKVLLKEIHHRVKNNMQVISSLLRLQSRHIKDKEALELFEESRDRIKSMALVQEQLYQSGDLARIDIAVYIRNLTTHLFTGYGVISTGINFDIEIKDVLLDVNTAIPCGLIINELVTNSLKHAFPDGRGGEIKIAMRTIKDNPIELIVSDTGIGFPEDLDFQNTDSLGLQIVCALVDQLNGTIELDRAGSAEFTIAFANPEDKEKD